MSNKEFFNSLMSENPATVFIGKLFHSRDVAHICHLSTKSFAQHKALDEYYHGIIGLTDELVEMYQGEIGIIQIKIPASEVEDPISYLTELCSYIESNKSKIFTKSYLLNKIDEILELIYSTLYKLKNLK